MRIGRLVQAASITGAALFAMAVSASASPIINYSTSGAAAFTSTGFGGGTSTLTFTGNAGASSGVPSVINLGDFELVCTACSTSTAGTAGAVYASGQTFQLNVNDTTDTATGHFIGTLAGGAIFSNSSPLSISWGSFVVDSGNFHSTIFTIFSPTPLAAPNSGSPAGDTTVQGHIDSTATPEPMTLSLVGGGLLGLGLLRRKRVVRP